MAEYIKREDVLALTREIHVKEVDYRTRHIDPDEVRELPAADVVPVRHGRWLESENGPMQKCSVCGATGWDGFYYCPNCGAKMDGEQ